MALFNDGPPACMEDLVGQDSQLPDVASGEGIDTTVKLSLAQDQVGLEIQELLDSNAGGPPLANVVVTKPLRLWHTYWTLEMIYADAFFNALNDRYRQKRDQFRVLARWAFDRIIEAGVGLVYDPMPRPEPPDLAPVAGSLAAGTYYITMTWVNQAAGESSPARPEIITISGGSFSVIPGAAPPTATGWNIFAGVSPETMVLQNDVLISRNFGWTQATAVRTTGRSPGRGQLPDYYKHVPRVFRRG